MTSPGGLRAALDGRAARAHFAETEQFDEASFTAADRDALAGTWSSLGADAGAAAAAGFDGLIDDDVAFVSPWGFDLADVLAPVLVVQGGEDRVVPPAHAEYIARHLPRAELWLRPDDGHVSVLAAAPPAMDWLVRG
jgi:pimeloyl-ACP methyl ester carboxylesterase